MWQIFCLIFSSGRSDTTHQRLIRTRIALTVGKPDRRFKEGKHRSCVFESEKTSESMESVSKNLLYHVVSHSAGLFPTSCLNRSRFGLTRSA